jgi:hypothetical protein
MSAGRKDIFNERRWKEMKRQESQIMNKLRINGTETNLF